MERTLLVTGGAGFIGANFVSDWLASENTTVINLDALTYAGNLRNLDALRGDPRHVFVRGDINDRALVAGLLDRYRPAAIVHFAAESHVDRSILGPDAFIRSNIEGTFNLLEAARIHWQALSMIEQQSFRFLHVSTDEVFGSLGPADPPFSESTPYAPNSPYAASKAASDHLVRAWHHTYGLPTLMTNCSNNYGPMQFPEKLIPLMILNAVRGLPLPVYGDGANVRDWLYVGDHCAAIRTVLERGRPGQTWNIGGRCEKTNLEVVHTLCTILDELLPPPSPGGYARLLRLVADRPGHDRRYAMDAGKIERELGWQPAETFATGMRKTVAWYLAHADWIDSVQSGSYRDWIEANDSVRTSP